MAVLDRLNDVTALLQEWQDIRRQSTTTVPVLEKIADLVETEYETHIKSDPDPFDDRHTGRNDPDCVYVHVMKSLANAEDFMDYVLDSCVLTSPEDFPLCCAAMRLLFHSMFCLESRELFEDTEGFVPKLYEWAENEREPLRSYSLGLLGFAMTIQDLTGIYKENNSRLVRITIMRLKYLRDIKDLNQPAVEDFSKAKTSHRTKNSNKCAATDKKVKHLKPSSFKLKELTVSMQIRLLLRYLTTLGEYQEFLQMAFELDVRSLCCHFINVKYINEDYVILKALQFLTSLMCHKKFALEFVSHGGIEKLLQIPRPSFSATAVSCCFYYLAYVQDALERICLLPQPVLAEVVKYVLWLLECSHYSGRCHATIFFSLTFSFRAILTLFDANDGLRKLINMLSTLEILVASVDVLDDFYVFDCRQTVKHTCVALRRYFDAHVAIKADALRRSMARSRCCTPPTPTPAYKSMTFTQRSILDNVELLLENPQVVAKWPAVDMMRNLQGFSLLIQVICLSVDWSTYNARNDVTRLILDTFAVLTVSQKTQLALLEPVTLPTGGTEVGIKVLLRAAEGDLAADGDIQRAALLVLCNCVCFTRKPSSSGAGKAAKGRRSYSKAPDELQERLWNCVRANNGIRILLSLLLVKTPITDADHIRGLACKALCGLAKSDKIRQIIGKLPMIHSGQLQLLMREPILSDNASEHATFCHYVSELVERVLGKTIQEPQSLLSLSRITKADVVAQTQITYPNQELLQLIYRQLENQGLTQTASTLLKEANLPPPRPLQAILSPQNNAAHRKVRFSMSRPSPLVGLSPTPTPVASPGTPTVHRVGSTNPGTPLGKHNFLSLAKQSLSYNRSTSPPTLDSIVTQYLRNQHALCANPVAVCPPFSLLRPHSCPEPKQRRHASVNIASRLAGYKISSCYGGYEGNKLNRRHIYSRFRTLRVLKDLDEVSYYTCAAFLPGTQQLLTGTQAGEVKVFNYNTAEYENTHLCHRSVVTSCQPSSDGQMLLTSSPFGTLQSILWSIGERLEMKTSFPDARYVQFSKQTLNKVIGTRGSTADIYDLTTGDKLMTLSDPKTSNNYYKNKATFNWSDELVLNDGVLWDVRGKQVIHKFDKFNNYVSGMFHPSDLEIIINSEIWDMRSFHLLDTCPSLDQCNVTFNNKGDVMFGVRLQTASRHEDIGKFDSSFRTIDAIDFQPIATYDVKKSVHSLAIHESDCMLAVVENQGSDDATVESICRLYEIGRTKGEDEDEEKDDEDDEDDDNDDMESGEDDDLGDFLVPDDEEDNEDIQNALNMIRADLNYRNDGDEEDDDIMDDAAQVDDDDSLDDDDSNDDDDDIRFLLPNMSSTDDDTDTSDTSDTSLLSY